MKSNGWRRRRKKHVKTMVSFTCKWNAQHGWYPQAAWTQIPTYFMCLPGHLWPVWHWHKDWNCAPFIHWSIWPLSDGEHSAPDTWVSDWSFGSFYILSEWVVGLAVASYYNQNKLGWKWSYVSTDMANMIHFWEKSCGPGLPDRGPGLPNCGPNLPRYRTRLY